MISPLLASEDPTILLLLSEGAASALFPCTLVLLLPGIASAFTSKWKVTQSLASYLASFTIVSWLLLAGRIGYWSPWVLAILLGLATLLAWRDKGEDRARSVASPLLLGIAIAHLWEPCIGKSFGTLVQTLPADGPSSLPRYGAYALGLAVPLGFAAIAAWLLPDKAKHATEKYFRLFGIGFLIVLAVSLATNTHTSVISQLSAWSSWS